MPLSELEAEFVAVLREVGRRPGMNIGSQSFERLCGFIGGYLFNRLPIGAHGLPLMLKFRDWLRRHTGIDKEAGWEQFIRFYSTSDHDAFVGFFHQFEVFLRDLQQAEAGSTTVRQP
jgi:hypothetical protein